MTLNIVLLNAKKIKLSENALENYYTIDKICLIQHDTYNTKTIVYVFLLKNTFNYVFTSKYICIYTRTHE